MALKLNIIVASTRPGRRGLAVGEWASALTRRHSAFEVELCDLKSFSLPLFDEPNHPVLKDYQHEHTQRWSCVNDAADAFVFVMPEYDYFPPASLVNAIQALHKEWQRKPAGIVGYGGVSGGLRAIQAIKLLLAAVNIMPISQEVPVPFFSKSISEDGIFRPIAEVEQGMKLMLGELSRWAEALAVMRMQRALDDVA